MAGDQAHRVAAGWEVHRGGGFGSAWGWRLAKDPGGAPLELRRVSRDCQSKRRRINTREGVCARLSFCGRPVCCKVCNSASGPPA